MKETIDDQNVADEEMKALFADKSDVTKQSVEPNLDQQRLRVLKRIRMNAAQSDTVLFAFIKLWTTLAELLAPIFANFAAKKMQQHKPTKINRPANKVILKEE